MQQRGCEMARRGMRKGVYWGSLVLGWFEHLQDNELTSADYRILFFLCENMKESDNTAYKRQKQIAQELNMDKGNVSKCIKRLSEKQFIAKASNGFMINPHLFYVGKTYKTERALLRNDFESLLSKKNLQSRFSLNEDEHKLEIETYEINNTNKYDDIFAVKDYNDDEFPF